MSAVAEKSSELTLKQWGVVAAVGLASAPGGPIVAGLATLGTVAGCVLSNVCGWDGEDQRHGSEA